LNSHHIFTEAFRGHPLLDVKALLGNSGCQCLQRLFLCGYTFTSSEDNVFDNTINNKRISITPGEGLYATWSPDDSWKEIRNALRHRIFVENPFMQQDVEQFRESVLRNKIIGLSQRSGRRRWNNLNEIEQECDLVFRQHKIICTEINVENEEFRPYHHAVAHGGLDALFGIHGAQLTEALWMKPGSLVVEFLPWVHEDMIMGGWTRTVSRVT
jgi:Glycosyltransferase 61